MEFSFVEELKFVFVILVDDDILDGVDDGEDFFDRFEIFQIFIELNFLFLVINDMEDDVEVKIEIVIFEFVSEDVKDEGDNEIDEVI